MYVSQPALSLMDNDYEGLCGVSEVELEDYFGEGIGNLGEKLNYRVEEMKEVVKME